MPPSPDPACADPSFAAPGPTLSPHAPMPIPMTHPSTISSSQFCDSCDVIAASDSLKRDFRVDDASGLHSPVAQLIRRCVACPSGRLTQLTTQLTSLAPHLANGVA